MLIKRIRELMISIQDYPHVHEGQSLADAIRELENCEIHFADRKSLPRTVLVLSKEHQLIGMLRRRDIMRGLEPEFMTNKPIHLRKSLFDVELDPNLLEMTYEKALSGVRVRAKRPVSDLMIPIDFSVEHSDHIVKAMYEMVEHNLSLLPVMDKDRIIGVVRSVDVFRELAILVLDQQELPNEM